MAQLNIRVAIEIDAPVKQVWRILGAFDGLPAISTATTTSRLEDAGRVRVLTGRDGGILWERMLQFDEIRRRLAYEIFDTKGCESLAYGTGYVGNVRVVPCRGGRATTFVYRARFTPLKGTSAKQARAAVADFAADCARGVCRVLGLKRGVVK